MTAIAAAANAPSEQGIPLTRLVKIEVRKALDTRAGFWLSVVIAGLSALILVLTAAGVLESDLTDADILRYSFAPIGALFPYVAILLVTSEFSARTALTTFVLVPNRWRVITAKLLAVIVIAAVLLLAVTVLSLLVGAVSPDHVATPAGGVTLVDAIWRTAVQTAISVIGAFGLGLLLRNTAAAIVTRILLPTFISAALILTPGLEGAEPWIGTGALAKLTEDEGLNGTDWAQVGTSSLIWLVLPLVFGLWRLNRAEIK